MSYGRLQEKEQALSAEITDLIEKASRCDQDEDKAYKDKTGYELPEDLKFKQGRLAKIKAAKKALEQREEQINPGQAIEANQTNQLCRYRVWYHGQKRQFRLRLQRPDQRRCRPANHCGSAYQPKR